MPLNIGASGSIKPYVKFNAKADKWFAKGENGDVEIARPTFIADLPNIATGWLRFLEGQAPERVMDTSLDRAAPNPGNGFKRGFMLAVYSQKFFGGFAELSERLDPHGQRHPRGLLGLRGGACEPSGSSAGDRLHRLGAHEGSLRHQLPAEARDREVGGSAGGAARPESGRSL